MASASCWPGRPMRQIDLAQCAGRARGGDRLADRRHDARPDRGAGGARRHRLCADRHRRACRRDRRPDRADRHRSRATKRCDAADIVLWLGDDRAAGAGGADPRSRARRSARTRGCAGRRAMSPCRRRPARGWRTLWRAIADRRGGGCCRALDAAGAQPAPARLHAPPRVAALRDAAAEGDLLIVAEHLRRARLALDRVTGAQRYRGDARRVVRPLLHRQIIVPRGTALTCAWRRP